MRYSVILSSILVIISTMICRAQISVSKKSNITQTDLPPLTIQVPNSIKKGNTYLITIKGLPLNTADTIDMYLYLKKQKLELIARRFKEEFLLGQYQYSWTVPVNGKMAANGHYIKVETSSGREGVSNKFKIRMSTGEKVALGVAAGVIVTITLYAVMANSFGSGGGVPSTVPMYSGI